MEAIIKARASARDWLRRAKGEEQPSDLEQILGDIARTNDELAAAVNRFNFSCDDLLIDAAAFEMQALESRLAFLYRNAKEKGLHIGAQG